jgi:hypothetical protein
MTQYESAAREIERKWPNLFMEGWDTDEAADIIERNCSRPAPPAEPQSDAARNLEQDLKTVTGKDWSVRDLFRVPANCVSARAEADEVSELRLENERLRAKLRSALSALHDAALAAIDTDTPNQPTQ